ncbi:ABC transporter permease [Flavobacterium sp. CF136]|uniref:ABC transporter permease n=1 Tax=Flavobacterium sp. (strain CF136) TaxID=1144313 RepID=UPI0002718588|nr:FtsX-like permease family protein [Flavobacterium sp. CF136]EJL62780.1 ABC-type transport system, involved in lipoprotein release, permease component [Flavobacterium sp. CF136]
MKNINYDIALTHILTRKKQTLVAALGVTIGVAIYLFMNSLGAGFNKYGTAEIFKNNAHIKIYKKDETSSVLSRDKSTLNVIVNPQVTTLSKTIINPQSLLNSVRKEPYITNAIEVVDVSVFYNKGKTQLKGTSDGVNMVEYAQMYNTSAYMLAGDVKNLKQNLNGIIIGKGIAEKFSLNMDDNITVTSSYGVSKVLKVVGIFSMGNSLTDDSKSFMNISTAQQFLKEGSSYVTTIYANTVNSDNSTQYAQKLQALTSYTVEDWKTSNADILSSDVTRKTLMTSISLSILLVAAFGIYNILSATITQKINDIAILKALGFKGKDVIRIFITEAVIMGIIGNFLGLCFGGALIYVLSHIQLSGTNSTFPIYFEAKLFAQSFLLGLIITICAGYFPAKKAANVDPVSIFRK